MAIRLNQEVVEIASSGVTATSNVRVNQEVELIASHGLAATSNVRVNQEVLLLLIPVAGKATNQVQFIGW